MKKNILGMNMTEWKHLSGLADPYKLALAEAGVDAGVPPVVESKAEVAEDDDDSGVPREIQVAQAAAGKKQRLDSIKRAARNLRGKTRNAIDKAANTPAKDRHQDYLTRMKAKSVAKAEDIEGIDPDILWAVYLEDIGSSPEEFCKLLDLAIESDDEDLAIELIAIEDQLDEILGAIGAGVAKVGSAVGKGAMAVGKTVAKGAMAVGKGVVKGAEAAGGALKQGFKAGMGGGSPAAGGAAPAAAAPPAGEPPAATQSAPAAPATAATAAAPAAAPTGSAGAQTAGNANGGPAAAAGGAPGAAKEPKKIGLLGTLGRGIGKVAKGVAGMGAATAGIAGKVASGVGQVAQGAKAGYKEDVEAWEEFVSEEFGVTAEQYVEMFDKAIAEDDHDILGNAHQIDEIFASWRAKKAAAAQDQQARVKAGYQAAKAVIAKHGVDQVKAASLRGKAVDVPKPKVAAGGGGTSIHAKKAESVEDIANQIMESTAREPRVKPSTLKDLMSDQLRFSGYTDEHIARKRG